LKEKTMIISDLSYLESFSAPSSVVGGGKNKSGSGSGLVININAPIIIQIAISTAIALGGGIAIASSQNFGKIGQLIARK
jgi:hypothetical protein